MNAAHDAAPDFQSSGDPVVRLLLIVARRADELARALPAESPRQARVTWDRATHELLHQSHGLATPFLHDLS